MREGDYQLGTPKFRILTVCTGNICRSPLAEALLRKYLPAQVFTVSSAGIMATAHTAVPKPQLRIAKKLGAGDLSVHQPRLVTQELVDQQDLILAMSRAHRRRLMRLDPSVVRRTFTIREFARLASLVTPNDIKAEMTPDTGALNAAVAAVAAKRGLMPPPENQDEFDIVDPFRQGRATYRRSRDELVPAAELTADFLNLVANLFGDAALGEDDVDVARPTQGDSSQNQIDPADMMPEAGAEETGADTVDDPSARDAQRAAMVAALPKRSQRRRHEPLDRAELVAPVRTASGGSLA